MRRISVLVAAIAVALVGSFADVHVPLRVAAQESTPAVDGEGPPPGFADETLAFGIAETLPSTPAIILLDRLTIDPGTSIPGEPDDPSFTFILVESGSLTIRADAPLAITRAAALAEALAAPGEMPTMEEVAADTDVTIEAGDSIVFLPAIGVDLRNDGSEPAVLLGAVIFPA